MIKYEKTQNQVISIDFMKRIPSYPTKNILIILKWHKRDPSTIFLIQSNASIHEIYIHKTIKAIIQKKTINNNYFPHNY